MWPIFLQRRRRRANPIVADTSAGPDDRALGDAAREAGDWKAAAAAYERHLRAAPGDGAIWVQLGHALKESGHPAAAAEAYRQAGALPESGVEGLFQLGLVLWGQGAGPAAIQALQEALRLAPRFDICQALAEREGAMEPLPVTSLGRPVLALDVSDLLNFLVVHGFPTGIQRVQLGMIAAFLRDGAEPAAPFEEIQFCFATYDWPWRLAPEDLLAVLRYVEEGQVDLAVSRRLVEQAKARAVCASWSPGTAYLVLGAFWSGQGVALLQQRLKPASVTFGVLTHDLFAVTMPQLCEEGAVAAFETQLNAGLATWDFIVANSKATAADVQAYIARHAPQRSLPVLVAPLAHDFATAHDGARPPAPLPDGLAAGSFVLCVGTIEPRKNHRALLAAWAKLGRRRADLPELVIAGRPGWRSEDVVEQLRAGAIPKVRWLEDLSDGALDALYRGCLFSVFPSVAEGWGLPIGESLARGKVCVTSEVSAMPEVGGRFAVYVDPGDSRSLETALARLLDDPAGRIARETEIRAEFKPRTWADVARTVMTEVGAVTPQTY
jgi:glycosyltransferase involved in cell wall biosynthesis